MAEREGVYRRRLSEGRREHRTVIKHTAEEWVRVVSLARAQGVSVPRLYERAVHAGDVVAAAKLTRVVDELLFVQRLMANATNNLNQIAKVANTNGEVARAEDIGHHADAIREQADRVFALMAEAGYEEPRRGDAEASSPPFGDGDSEPS